MQRRQFNATALLAATAGVASLTGCAGGRMTWGRKFEQISWPQLAPKDGSLERYFASFNRKEVSDTPGDLRTQAILNQLKVLSRQMPTLGTWDGRQVAIAGRAVMYNTRNLLLERLLLAPYEVSCAHYPPPPGNQLIHVQLAQPMPTLHARAPLLISGRLQRMDTEHPTSFSRYTLLDAKYEHFDDKPEWLPAYPYI